MFSRMVERALSPRWRKVLRDLQLHPSRTALVVLAMVVGLAGAGSVLDTWSLMRQVTREEYRASRPASATLRVDSVSAAIVAQVRAMTGIAAVQARRTVNGGVRVAGAASPRSLVVFALDDFESSAIGKVLSEAGQWPPRDGELVIERSSVDYAGASIGDSLLVQVGDNAPITMAITGIARDVGLAPGWMEHVVYTFASPSSLRSLGLSATFNELQFVVRDSTLDRDGIRRVAQQVQQLLQRNGRTVTAVDVPVPGRHIHAAQIDSLLFTQGAFGAIALLLSGILVVNLIGAMLTGQVREIGVMKAIGATPRQIAQMYLLLAFLLGLVACAIAIPLAAFVGRWYADFTADLLNFSTKGFAIPSSAFLVQLAVGLIFPVAAAAIPVSRGCRISVGEALRDVGITATGSRAALGDFGKRLDAMGGMARPLLLSLRNAFRKRLRMSLTLLTLAMGGAVYIGALNLRTSVRGAVGLLFDTQRYDMALRTANAWPADSLEAVVRAIGGVGDAEAWSAARATLDRGDGLPGNAFPVSAPTPGTAMLKHDITAGRWLNDSDERAIVVNRRLSGDEPSMRVGATVNLVIAGRTQPWHVVGIVESGPSPASYAPRATIAAITAGGRVDRMVVASSLRGPASQLDLMQRLRAALAQSGYPVQTGQMMVESRKVTEDHLLMVAGFLGIMGQLMIVVGGLALASTMGMAVLERTREIGVLRAIGARHGAIMTMVQIEGLVIALLGWALAIPLSLPMSVVLGRAFGRIMLPLAVTWMPDVAGVVQWLGVVLVVSVVACAWPAWRATRITTRAALAYE
ncbi:MAG: ABC transporter permease [Gemmatimonadaceae bacterium]|nr:ABC transporter permease [Gemmatimonadaceae bacterium]